MLSRAFQYIASLEAKSLCLAGGDSIQQHPLLIVARVFECREPETAAIIDVCLMPIDLV